MRACAQAFDATTVTCTSTEIARMVSVFASSHRMLSDAHESENLVPIRSAFQKLSICVCLSDTGSGFTARRSRRHADHFTVPIIF